MVGNSSCLPECLRAFDSIALSSELVEGGGLPLCWEGWRSCVQIVEAGSVESGQECVPLITRNEGNSTEATEWVGPKILLWAKEDKWDSCNFKQGPAVDTIVSPYYLDELEGTLSGDFTLFPVDLYEFAPPALVESRDVQSRSSTSAVVIHDGSLEEYSNLRNFCFLMESAWPVVEWIQVDTRAVANQKELLDVIEGSRCVFSLVSDPQTREMVTRMAALFSKPLEELPSFRSSPSRYQASGTLAGASFGACQDWSSMRIRNFGYKMAQMLKGNKHAGFNAQNPNRGNLNSPHEILGKLIPEANYLVSFDSWPTRIFAFAALNTEVIRELPASSIFRLARLFLCIENPDHNNEQFIVLWHGSSIFPAIIVREAVKAASKWRSFQNSLAKIVYRLSEVEMSDLKLDEGDAKLEAFLPSLKASDGKINSQTFSDLLARYPMFLDVKVATAWAIRHSGEMGQAFGAGDENVGSDYTVWGTELCIRLASNTNSWKFVIDRANLEIQSSGEKQIQGPFLSTLVGSCQHVVFTEKENQNDLENRLDWLCENLPRAIGLWPDVFKYQELLVRILIKRGEFSEARRKFYEKEHLDLKGMSREVVFAFWCFFAGRFNEGYAELSSYRPSINESPGGKALGAAALLITGEFSRGCEQLAGLNAASLSSWSASPDGMKVLSVLHKIFGCSLGSEKWKVSMLQIAPSFVPYVAFINGVKTCDMRNIVSFNPALELLRSVSSAFFDRKVE